MENLTNPRSINNWSDLRFWQTGEWQVIQERLSDITKFGRGSYCPGRANLFRALDTTPYKDVKVVFIAQDPYPNPKDAMGLAFSIPKGNKFTPTLINIFNEYTKDLHYPMPTDGDLTPWAKEGVLLWNAIPTCLAYSSLSHNHWVEWYLLTEEILKALSNRNVVFVFFGSVSKEFSKYLSKDEEIIQVSHPSPRASLKAKNPFLGSRIFTRVNSILTSKGVTPIDWRL